MYTETMILLKSRKKIMLKFILSIFLFAPLSIYAKSFITNMSPCDIGTSCKKCYEVVQVTYSVEVNKKQIVATGIDNTGKQVSDVVNNCTITNMDNWSCNTTAFVIQANNAIITLQNKSNSSLARSNKEICLIK